MLISRKPYLFIEIERFQRNFWPTGYLCRVAMPIFKKILSRQKWWPFWIFEFLAKIAKHKNAYISKTLLDIAISTKFLTHRVSLQSSHANFQKNFCLAKNGGHFEFSNFCTKIAKHKNANISKTVLHRTILTKFLIFKVSAEQLSQRAFTRWSIADSQFFSNNSFTYFWKSFHMVKFQTRR